MQVGSWGQGGGSRWDPPAQRLGSRLTCSGRAEEDGPVLPPPAPPCPRARAFPAVHSAAMGRLPGAAAAATHRAPPGCQRRSCRSLNHTLGGGSGGGKKKKKTKKNFAARNLKRGSFPAPAPAERQRLPVPGSAPPSLSRCPPARLHTPGSPSSGGPRPGRYGDSARPQARAGSGQRGQGRSSRLEFSSPRAERPGGRFGLSPFPFQPPGRGAESLQVGRARGSDSTGDPAPSGSCSAQGSQLGRPVPVVERAGDLSRVYALKFPCNCAGTHGLALHLSCPPLPGKQRPPRRCLEPPSWGQHSVTRPVLRVVSARSSVCS